MKLKLKKFFTFLPLIAAAAFVIHEGQAVVRYEMAIGKVNQSAPSKKWWETSKADINFLAKCDSLYTKASASNDFEYMTPQWRQCHNDAATSVQSTFGYVTYISRSSSWLSEHGKDDEVRELALDMLKKGRDQLIYDQLMVHGPAAKAHDILATSVMYRLMGEGLKRANYFANFADTLDRLETSIFLPDLVKQQQNWRIKTHGQLHCTSSADECVAVAVENSLPLP